MSVERISPARDSSEDRGSPRVHVVDLSERPPHDPALTALEEGILEALREAPLAPLPQDALLARVRRSSFLEVTRALQDLARRGLVQVRWSSPFRFLATLRHRERIETVPGSPPAQALTA